MKKETKAARFIKNALWELLKEKAYSDITITELVDRAGVARVSYYRLFNSFDEILDEVLISIFQNVFTKIEATFYGDGIKVSNSKANLTYFFKNITELQMSGESVANGNVRIVLRRLSKIYDENHPIDGLTLKQKYLPFINVGLMFIIASRWAETGMKETPEELAELVFSLGIYDKADLSDTVLP